MSKSETEISNKLEAISLFTDITDETLLTHCRNSKAFENIQDHEIHLRNLRMAWFSYLIELAKTSDFDHAMLNNSTDAWRVFEEYARTTAVAEMKAMEIDKFEGKLLRTMKPTSKHCGYAVYDSILGGESRIYNNGEIVPHRRRNASITFCATFVMTQKMLAKSAEIII